VAAYYYLRILVVMYMQEPGEGALAVEPLPLGLKAARWSETMSIGNSARQGQARCVVWAPASAKSSRCSGSGDALRASIALDFVHQVLPMSVG